MNKPHVQLILKYYKNRTIKQEEILDFVIIPKVEMQKHTTFK